MNCRMKSEYDIICVARVASTAIDSVVVMYRPRPLPYTQPNAVPCYLPTRHVHPCSLATHLLEQMQGDKKKAHSVEYKHK